MPSPFPGMNPYLEQDDSWEDFHQTFMTYAREVIGKQVGVNYLVKIGVRLYLEKAQRESFLEILDRRNRVVTVLELLSPANKAPGRYRDAYLGKRCSLLATQTHLVEIDLRRGGIRPFLRDLPASDYFALVTRYEERPHVRVWPIPLRQSLPTLPIPLTAPDPDISLDLQALVHRVYDSADYGKYIYTETPQPPLTPDDLGWSQQFFPKS